MNDINFATFQGLLTKDMGQSSDVFARFYDRVIKTDDINPKTGMPVFKTTCFVQIRIKNNSSEVYDQPATEEKINRFPIEYNRYLLSKKQTETGTPLAQCAFLSLAQVEMLKYYGIFTVEALNDLSEEKATDLDVLTVWRQAKEFQTLSALKTEYEALKEKCALLEAENQALKEKKKRKRTSTLEKNTLPEETQTVCENTSQEEDTKEA